VRTGAWYRDLRKTATCWLATIAIKSIRRALSNALALDAAPCARGIDAVWRIDNVLLAALGA